MGYQALQGIRITPRGSYNLSRFSHSLEGNSWPNSFAFGGWIYSASCDIGFSAQPTEIKISIVLEAAQRKQVSATFDIKPQDLRCDAGDGDDENLYDINLNGITFSDFVLFNYEISIEGGAKVLHISFRDYSIILDKIYVGLLKRQGNRFVHTATSLIELPVQCTDCQLNGTSFTQLGYTYRDLNFGSYVGINGNTYDNFAGLINNTDNVYRQWNTLLNTPESTLKFDLNGGFLILGTEEVTEEKCGDLGNITYNFHQLLASLRLRGIRFDGEFPRAVQDSDFAYRQNYIGTLREVLQQWCADLGYDFYCEGKRFIGLNTNRALDIQKVVDIVDPTTELGSQFALNTNSSIISYSETNGIANSYKQAIITADTRPRVSRTHSKTPRRYIGFTPLHPIDFNIPNRDLINRYDLFGNQYRDYAWTHSFEPGSTDLSKTVSQLDNRTFAEIDTAIALSHFDADLRDIYCQDRAIYGETHAIRQANFKALGMVPLIEITNPEEKMTAIEAAFSSAGDEISNICLDSRFYKVFLGYYYSKFKEDVVQWEQIAADSMYRFGALTKGLLQGLPYVPQNVLQDASPAYGLYGTYGTSLTQITHSYEPDAKQYFDLYNAPFKDIILYSGLKNRGNYLPEEVYVAELSNDWGTTQENFKREMSLRLDDACVQEYSNQTSYTSYQNDIEKKFQDWRLSLFRPQVISDIEKFYEDYEHALAKLGSLTEIDRTVQTYYDLNYTQSNTCAKLHLIILTDTRTHPNIYINFNRRGREFTNPVVLQKYYEKEREAIIRKSETKTPSLCDKSLLQEMCDGIIISSGAANVADPRFSCATESEYDTFEEGFDITYLSQPNSRGLDIQIVKNPVRNTDADKLQALFRNSDINGEFYYTDVIERDLSIQQKQANLTIIYPISVAVGADTYYRGILSSDISVENRSPEVVEIYGEPPNLIRNTAANIRVINNSVDPDLQPQLDPISSRFVSYLTTMTGDNKVISTVKEYHEAVKRLNNYEITGTSKSVDLTLAGTPDHFGSFSGYLSPNNGMNRMSISVNDNGVVTSLSFSDRPPQPPKQESVLNKIGPRIV